MNGALCSITTSPFAPCTSKLAASPIQRPFSLEERIGPSGKRGYWTRDRVYQYLAQGCWFRVNNSGTVHLGTYEYRFGYRYRGQTMEITFDPARIAFVCQPEGATEPVIVSARGRTSADLMGDLAWMLALPAYQLAFPFSPEEQRRLALVECLSGTTL
jgi:hypothetical protein